MTLIERIIAKHQEDRDVIKAMKQRHADELRVIEEFQAKREDALLEQGDITAFAYMTDLFINGRDGKTETEKAKANIALNQTKIEKWLLKMLNQVGDGIKTEFGTVYKTRKEAVACADFEMFVKFAMLPDAAAALADAMGFNHTPEVLGQIITTLYEHLHLEYINKAVNKTAILELMGEQAKDGSRPNTPPAGVNYTAIQTVGVRKAK